MKSNTTERGFRVDTFLDRYGTECNIQKSSLAFEDCIWIGVISASPKILASKVVEGGTGWAHYPIHEDVTFKTRMHLTRKMVAGLLPALNHFVETGNLPDTP